MNKEYHYCVEYGSLYKKKIVSTGKVQTKVFGKYHQIIRNTDLRFSPAEAWCAEVCRVEALASQHEERAAEYRVMACSARKEMAAARRIDEALLCVSSVPVTDIGSDES